MPDSWQVSFVLSLVFFAVSSTFSRKGALEWAQTVLVSKLVHATLASAGIPYVTFIYGEGVSLDSFYGGQSVLFYLIISVGLLLCFFLVVIGPSHGNGVAFSAHSSLTAESLGTLVPVI